MKSGCRPALLPPYPAAGEEGQQEICKRSPFPTATLRRSSVGSWPPTTPCRIAVVRVAGMASPEA